MLSNINHKTLSTLIAILVGIFTTDGIKFSARSAKDSGADFTLVK